MRAVHLFKGRVDFPFHMVILFCFPLFFIFLADSVMSYLFPILVENGAHSNSIMGLIMALSSVVGIACDFVFPQLLRGRSWKFELTAGIVLAFLFPIFTNLGAVYSSIFFFLIASLLWGIYYEFLQFTQQSFIVGVDSHNGYVKDWSLLYFVDEITVIVGPIVGSLLLRVAPITSNVVVNFLQVLSLTFAVLIMLHIPTAPQHIPKSQIRQSLGFIRELLSWKELGGQVWPAIIVGITVTFVNASYWTIGGLLGTEIAGKLGLDWLVMVLFGVPLIVGSLLLAKYTIRIRKKHFSQLSLLSGGAVMATIFLFHDHVLGVLLIIVVSSLLFSFAGPLNEAVYSDLLERSGKGKLNLLGIAKSNASFAYIVAPLFVGILADKTNYYVTLSMVGGITAVVAVILLIFTPRKIHLSLDKNNI